MIVIGVDTGGTFTDFVYFDGSERRIFKVLSTPENPAEAVLAGLNVVAEDKRKDIVHGSTVATNAILERKGAKTALITNRGFEDIIEIGRQNRERIYDLKYRKPASVIPSNLRFGIDCRILSDGKILKELDLREIRDVVDKLKRERVESVAVCFLFSFVNPSHELSVKEILTGEDFHSSLSHQILPEFREYERTSTTVLNAYVAPIMKRYITYFMENLGSGDRLRIMQSNGGSISADTAARESIRTILSGPAGGVIGAYEVAKAAGFEKIITFDMGGTSTDVSLVNKDVSLTTESKIGGFPVKVPMIDIHTVGAGGGSIAYVDRGGSLKVGPRSAGASPGPICYGRSGKEITVTDANLFLGRLIAEHFLGGKMKLHRDILNGYFAEMARQLSMDPVSLAQGILSVANSTMEKAIRVISVERGENPEEFALVAFGGAGGLHAPFLANNLSISTVLIPENPGTLSALGMLVADIVKDYSQTVMMRGADSTVREISLILKELEKKGMQDMIGEGIDAGNVVFEYYLDMRYLGQSHEIMVPYGKDYIERFHDYHKRFFGYRKEGHEVEIVNVRLRCKGRTGKFVFEPEEIKRKKIVRDAHIGKRDVFFDDETAIETSIIDRERLAYGNVVEGPAIIVEYTSTTIVPPGWVCEVDACKNLVISQF